MTEPSDDGLVSLKCEQPDCDYETGPLPLDGTGSAKMRIGQHRYVKHGIKGSGRKPKPGKPTREDLQERPLLTIVSSAAQEARGGTGKPTADKLTEGLGELVALSTIGMASYLAETDPNIADGPDGDPDRDAVVQYLSLPLDSAKDIMRPLATALAPTKINAKYGRTIVNNTAALGSFVDLGRLFMHYRHYMTTRHARSTAPGGLGGAPVIADMGAGVPAGSPTPGPQPQGQPMRGHVVSAEEVQAMRAGRQ